MSVLLGETELREHLMSTNEEYRKLAAEHQAHAEQLEMLLRRHHLNDQERLEEITLKKKKLALKDQMYMMIQRYRKEMDSAK